MDKKTRELAFKVYELRCSLLELKNKLLVSKDLSSVDKCRLIDSVIKLQELNFIKDAFDYAYDDWLSAMNDDIVSSRWYNENS